MSKVSTQVKKNTNKVERQSSTSPQSVEVCNPSHESIKRRMGIACPLSALYDKKHSTIGEFSSLLNLAQFCKSANLSIIQLLPVNDTGTQSSPYSALSAFALHPIYISLSELPEFEEAQNSSETFLQKYDEFLESFSYTNRFDYNGINNAKMFLLHILYEYSSVAKTKKIPSKMNEWLKKNDWVIPYSVYKNLKRHYMQSSWKNWKKEDRNISKQEIQKRWNSPSLKSEHLFYLWIQFRAHEQFSKVANELRKEDIILKGDIPILMNEDSCDAWAYPEIFNHEKRAGSPPDSENPLGQNWGFPTYNWKSLKEKNYEWWKKRLILASEYYGAYRLDHILGFFRMWSCNEHDTTAMLGYTEPLVALTTEQLKDAGFSDERIRWLSEPHIHTGLVEDITWNHENAYKILSSCATKIQNEELWIFNKSVRGNKDINLLKFNSLCTEDAEKRIKLSLSQKLYDRTLLNISKNKFVPLWTYKASTAWKSLNFDEQKSLENLFATNQKKSEALWKKQASEILKELTNTTKMIPCGEDLGADISCMNDVLKSNDIFSLKVIRWEREWEKDGMPFLPLKNYPPLSVSTTSVHDSSTLREWWEEENESVKKFIESNPDEFIFLTNTNDNSDKNKSTSANESFLLSEKFNEKIPFNEKIARAFFIASAKSASNFFINPLQDYLYLSQKYFLENSQDERINIPGTVNEFNWTYRMPVSLEILLKDVTLIKAIKKIADLHKEV